MRPILRCAGTVTASRSAGRSEDYHEAVREALDRAVLCRLRRAEGKIGTQLSGGLDSSTVTATAARLLGPNAKLTAFTAVSREATVDLSHGAGLAPRGPGREPLPGCTHTWIKLTPSVMMGRRFKSCRRHHLINRGCTNSVRLAQSQLQKVQISRRGGPGIGEEAAGLEQGCGHIRRALSTP